MYIYNKSLVPWQSIITIIILNTVLTIGMRDVFFLVPFLSIGLYSIYFYSFRKNELYYYRNKQTNLKLIVILTSIACFVLSTLIIITLLLL